MAHGDYNCCAVCDSKLAYTGNPTTKEEICPECLLKLQAKNLDIVTSNQLIVWIKKADKEKFKLLKEIGFQTCCFSNEVDKAYNRKLNKIKKES